MGDLLRELRVVVVALLVLAVPGFLVFKGYDASEEVENAPASPRGTAGATSPADSDPTKFKPSENMLRRENVARAQRALRDKVGSEALLLKVTVQPHAMEWHLRKGRAGQRATGFQWFANQRKLVPIEVNVVGTGDLDDEDFSLGRVRPEVVSKLDARVRDEDSEYRTVGLVLERVPPDAYLRWAITAEAEGRSGLVWNANPSGRGFADPSEFSRRRLNGS